MGGTHVDRSGWSIGTRTRRNRVRSGHRYGTRVGEPEDGVGTGRNRGVDPDGVHPNKEGRESSGRDSPGPHPDHRCWS